MTNLKDTKSIWKHLRTANKKTSTCDNALPDELEINGQQYTNSQDIAFKLNDYLPRSVNISIPMTLLLVHLI